MEGVDGLMHLAIVFLVFMTFLLTGEAIKAGVSRREEAVSRRLSGFSDGSVGSIREVELNRPLADRVLMPLLKVVAAQVAKNLPAERRLRLQKTLQRAGNPGNIGPAEFLAAKTVLVFLPILMIGGRMLNGDRDWRTLTGIALGVAVGWYGPELFLRMRMAQRQTAVRVALPDMLDLLTVSIEAGLGLDAALSRVAEKGSGPLAEEIRRVLQEVMMGKPRREALRDAAQRIGVEELHTFVNAVVQADRLGLGMANVLRQQSDQIRERRRQRIEEQAMKAPVKMLFPLVFFIFPAIFIVLLGPALIRIMEVMTKR